MNALDIVLILSVCLVVVLILLCFLAPIDLTNFKWKYRRLKRYIDKGGEYVVSIQGDIYKAKKSGCDYYAIDKNNRWIKIFIYDRNRHEILTNFRKPNKLERKAIE